MTKGNKGSRALKIISLQNGNFPSKSKNPNALKNNAAYSISLKNGNFPSKSKNHSALKNNAAYSKENSPCKNESEKFKV